MNINYFSNENKRFYSKIFKLVLPIIVQNLLSVAVNSADVMMLNYVGQSSISAVSLASQYASVLFMVYYGLGTGATMLCAQYYGKGDYKAIEIVEGIAMRFSIIISCIIALVAFTIPDVMLKVFTNDAELIAIGADYLRWMSIAYLCWGVIEVYLSVLRSIGKVMISTSLNIMAFVLNIFLNAIFIFGFFGAPRLGAMGVAIATSISRFVELIGCFIVSYYMKEVKLKFKYMFIKNRILLKDFIHMALPALGNDVAWGLAFSMYSVIIGHLGNDAVAANSFVTVVRNLGTVFCFGIASAGGILVGNVIGEGDMKRAKAYSSKVLKLTVLSGVVGGAIILAVMPLVMNVAALSDQAMHYLKYMMLINSYYVMGAAVNTTLIAGIFRAGGDSRFGLICDVIVMWGYAVPLGFFVAFVLKLPVMWVYFLLCTDEFVKWPWVFKNYKSGKWLKNITRDELYETKEEK